MLTCVAAAVIEIVAYLAVPEVTSDPRVRAELWTLFRDARFGHTNMEQSAFIIRDRDGRAHRTHSRRAGLRRHAIENTKTNGARSLTVAEGDWHQATIEP